MNLVQFLFLTFLFFYFLFKSCNNYIEDQYYKNQDKRIVLFDGICKFCNKFVNFILEYDQNNLHYFVSLQSPLGKELQEIYSVPKNLDSIIVIRKADSILEYLEKYSLKTEEDQKLSRLNLVQEDTSFISIKSTAVLEIFSSLNTYFSYFILFKKLVPLCIRDFIYDQFAKRRIYFFGSIISSSTDSCRIPTNQNKLHFL